VAVQGNEQSVNPRISMRPDHQNVDMHGTDAFMTPLRQ
jgi:hypothetical protein